VSVRGHAWNRRDRAAYLACHAEDADTLRDGRIVSTRFYWDNALFFTQLGLTDAREIRRLEPLPSGRDARRRPARTGRRRRCDPNHSRTD
jgi:hypothetical protein